MGAADAAASMRCCRSSTCAGVSTGDFQEALSALLGKDAPNLSPSVVGAADGRVAGRLRALAAARSVGPPLRLRLGRRGLPPGPHGGSGRVHAGADRRDAGGQEGTRRLPGGSARERSELAGTAGRREAARTDIAPEIAVGDGALGFWKALEEVFRARAISAAGCTRRANVLNKVPKSVQAAMKADLREIHGAPTRAAAESGDRRLRREVRDQVRQGRRLPDQGPRGPAGLLRLPRRALGPPAHLEPDRERVCHRAAPDGADQGLRCRRRRPG